MLTKRKRRVLKLWMLLSSSSAGHGTPLEHLVMSLAMMVPLLGASFVGAGSVGLYYAYVLFFDFLRCMGHSNVEVFQVAYLKLFPSSDTSSTPQLGDYLTFLSTNYMFLILLYTLQSTSTEWQEMKHLWGANWCIIGGPFEGEFTFDAEFSLGKRFHAIMLDLLCSDTPSPRIHRTALMTFRSMASLDNFINEI
ncbi:Protein ECERIFERUM 3 [Platanthera zijinensis]|uniref:Protein ECERIFERUM 3 n=1 Tax=Platanthera zijinensis TaxID=2320716 RepID=A0AAP0G2N8_9ASPA